MPRGKEYFFFGLFGFITLLNIVDLYQDTHNIGHGNTHLMIEFIVILVSIAALGYMVRELMLKRREMDELRNQLKKTREDLGVLSDKQQQATRRYGEVIQEQFQTWDLTPSEKEVALLLLKGLSFDQIAEVRDTKEKTVRQQATAIYRKSGLNGRHEFAAWFFEDFLS